jgi:hypothetical protein
MGGSLAETAGGVQDYRTVRFWHLFFLLDYWRQTQENWAGAHLRYF